MLVVALGGNALLQPGEKASLAAEHRRARTAMRHLLPILKKEKLVITHGNGPQVGAILLRSEIAKKTVYPLALAACNAESEGEIGYVLEQALRNLLVQKKIRREIASLMSLVEVSKTDRAFRHPSKPIGPFYSRAEADVLRKKGRAMVNDAGRGYRRVVPSPMPLRIIGMPVIGMLVRNKVIVIASGGGGIPVVRAKNGWQGVDAVIDKDHASACLAAGLRAETLMMLTDVPGVYLHYGTKSQRLVRRMSTAQARAYLAQGHFAAGSMKPKIEAAIRFLERNRAKKAIIASISAADAALRGKAGTCITR